MVEMRVNLWNSSAVYIVTTQPRRHKINVSWKEITAKITFPEIETLHSKLKEMTD